MPPSTPALLFHACSSTSFGRPTSGKPKPPATEANLDLLSEFRSHAAYWDAHTPTALVSTTSRLIRAIHTAFDKLYSGEDAGDIEIVIIDVPEVSRETTSVHRAEDLAGRLRWTEERRKAYRDEFLFEWEIPEGWVVPSSQSVYASAARPLFLDRLCGRHAAFEEGNFPRTREFSHEWFANTGGILKGFDKGLEAGRCGVWVQKPSDCWQTGTQTARFVVSEREGNLLGW
jgi:hypothetical protein